MPRARISNKSLKNGTGYFFFGVFFIVFFFIAFFLAAMERHPLPVEISGTLPLK
jgi:hypothetical protein